MNHSEIYPKDTGSRVLLDVAKYLPNHTALNPGQS